MGLSNLNSRLHLRLYCIDTFIHFDSIKWLYCTDIFIIFHSSKWRSLIVSFRMIEISGRIGDYDEPSDDISFLVNNLIKYSLTWTWDMN